MLLCKSLALLLALQLLGAVAGSTVKLTNNGYEDLVIAINPAVPEDQQIIANIKDMVTDASFYLFEATQRRAYFKSAKILIPLTWASNSSYLRPKAESFHKADVIIADPFLKYGDDPYTLQYGGCGEPAKYIHFTPNFATNDTLVQLYGPRGRVFVHEWAHLRWGVFDEYSDDQPFYFSSTFTPEATRCSQGVKGSNRFMKCEGESCSPRECRQNMLTGLWEDGCMFIPERNQTTKASIMYMPSLPSVVEFCNSNTHNIEAPNLQNRMCNFRSTWDVMMSSNDFKGVSPMGGTGFPDPPTFSMLQSRNRVVCLVLDTSSSMAVSDRMDRMYQAAELYLMQIIEHGSFVGIVTFQSQAVTSSPLRQILNEKTRKKLVAALPQTASGGRNLCAALKKAFQVNKQDGSANGTEIILLTAGDDDSKTRLCFPAVRNSGAVVHVIALGPDASEALENIATMTGGMRFSASDNLDSNDLIDAFSGISSGSGNLSQHAVQVESIALAIPATKCLDKTVAIDSTVGKDMVFVVTWQTQLPFIQVVDPFGGRYANGDFISETETKTARLQIPGTAHAGDWSYHLCNTHFSAQVLSLTVTSRASNDNVPPLNLKAHMNKDTNRFPNPMIVYAEVSQGYLPVLGANVTATIVTPRGTERILELYDSGAGADVVKNDGIYSRYFTAFDGDGRYSLKVRAEGRDKTTRRGFRMQRSQALYVPGYLDNGVPQMNPLRPVVTGDQAKLGVFTRTTSAGSFVVSASASISDLFPPCRVTDLRARIADNRVHLSWTAPGGDYDAGQAERYEIRMSTHPLDLKGNRFDKAPDVNVPGLTVGAAGSAETFSFTPESFPVANATIIYIALRATDRSGLRSDISNTAQAVMFVAPTMSPPTSPPTTVLTLDPTTPSIEAPSTDSTSRSAPTTTDPSTTATSRWEPSTELTFTSAPTTEDTSTITTTDQFPSTLTPTIKTTGIYSTMANSTSVTVNCTFNWTTVTQAPSPNDTLTSVPTSSTSNTSVISTRTVSTPDLSPNDTSSKSDSPPAPSSVSSTPPPPTNDTPKPPPSSKPDSPTTPSNVSSTPPPPTNDTSTPPPSIKTDTPPTPSNVYTPPPLTNDTSTPPPSSKTDTPPTPSNVSSTPPTLTNDTSTPPPSNPTHSTPASSNVSSTTPLSTNDTSTPPPSSKPDSPTTPSNVSSTPPPPTNDTSTPPPSIKTDTPPTPSNVYTPPPLTNDTSTPPPSSKTDTPPTPSNVSSTPPTLTNDTSTPPPSNPTHSTPASSNVSSTTPLSTNDTSTPPPSSQTPSTPASSNVSSTPPPPTNDTSTPPPSIKTDTPPTPSNVYTPPPLTNDTSTPPPSSKTDTPPTPSNVSSTPPTLTNDTSTPPPSNPTHSTPASSNVSSTTPLSTNDTSTPPPSNPTHSTPASSNVSSTTPLSTNDTSTPPPSNPTHSTPASSNVSSTTPLSTNGTFTPPPSSQTPSTPASSNVSSTPPPPTNDTSTPPPSNPTHSTPASSNVSSTTPPPANDTSTPPPSNPTHSTPASSNVSSTPPPPTNDTSTPPPSNPTHSTPASSNVSSTPPPPANDTSTQPPSNPTHSTPASSNVSSTPPPPANDTSTPPPSNPTHSTPASSNVSSTPPPPTNDTSTPPPSNPTHSTPASSNVSSTPPPPTNDTSTPPPSNPTHSTPASSNVSSTPPPPANDTSTPPPSNPTHSTPASSNVSSTPPPPANDTSTPPPSNPTHSTPASSNVSSTPPPPANDTSTPPPSNNTTEPSTIASSSPQNSNSTSRTVPRITSTCSSANAISSSCNVIIMAIMVCSTSVLFALFHV